MTTNMAEALRGAMPAVYTLVGALVGGWIARRSQHKQWVEDNKAREYRELLDALHDCVSTVTRARPNVSTCDQPAVNNAMTKASLVFADRIFILRPMRRFGLTEEWLKIKRLVFSEPGETWSDGSKIVYGVTSLGVREQELQDKILEAAQKDLGLRR